MGNLRGKLKSQWMMFYWMWNHKHYNFFFFPKKICFTFLFDKHFTFLFHNKHYEGVASKCQRCSNWGSALKSICDKWENFGCSQWWENKREVVLIRLFIVFIYFSFSFFFSCLFSTSSWRNYIDCYLSSYCRFFWQWDSCVYASEVKSTMDDVLSALRWYSLGVSIVQAIYQEYYGKK